MGIVDAINAVFTREQFVKFGNVVGKIFHIDRRILNILARLGVANNIAHQALARLAKFPDFMTLLAPEHGIGVSLAGVLPTSDELPHCRLGFFPAVPADFNDKDRAGITHHKIPVPLLRKVRLGAIEDVSVNELTSTWRVRQSEQIGLQRFVHTLKMTTNEGGM